MARRFATAVRSWTAVATAVSLILAQTAPIVSAQAATPKTTPAAKPAPSKPAAAQAATPAAEDVDLGWPRSYATPAGGEITIYQPQIATWEGQTHIEAFAAVSYLANGAAKNVLGSIKIEAETEVSLAERLVNFSDFQITEANFPALPKDQLKALTAEIVKVVPDDERILALDRVLEAVDRSAIGPNDTPGMKADPPAIFFSKTPAIIVNLDGEPIWSPIKENDLKFAVNTNWDLLLHDPTTTYYLRNGETWVTTKDLLKGPWAPAGDLPASFKKLPDDDNWKDVKAALPGKKIKANQVPKVFVSLQPAELILLTGAPSYILVQGTKDLLWVNNTESDVFRTGKGGTIYYLVAGRWFSAPDFTGPWTFATPSLPEAFKEIPLEHERSRVLASVPGTQQAAEAVLLAQVPETARVNIKTLEAPDVAYQGDPKFTPIEGTTLENAVNTDKDIIKFGDLYYMCYQGVWFMAKTASGPWEVTTKVPKEIYGIPTSSEVHHVTYVTVEDDDDSDEWATFAVVAGYTGLMIAWGCAVWGTGWYYPPYGGFYGGYPYYRPYYPTYGYSAWYNPWTGAYGRGMSVYGPYGGAGVGARYNPRTGTYARGAAAYGPYGSRGVAEAYNPRTGTYAKTRQGTGTYGSWGSTSVQRGDDWATTKRVTNDRTGTTTRVTRTDEGGAVSRRGPEGGGAIAGSQGGDIYAGKDGNVYRRQDGQWQQAGEGGWSNVDTPDRPSTGTAQTRDRAGQTAGQTGTRPSTLDSSTRNQLNRDSAARTNGNTRTKDYGSYRSGSSGMSGRSAGTYRPRSGGGGRRR